MSFIDSIVKCFKSDFFKRNVMGAMVAATVSTVAAHEVQKLIVNAEAQKAQRKMLEQSKKNNDAVEGEVVDMNDLPK